MLRWLGKVLGVETAILNANADLILTNELLREEVSGLLKYNGELEIELRQLLGGTSCGCSLPEIEVINDKPVIPAENNDAEADGS